jgi:hypothetical protein
MRRSILVAMFLALVGALVATPLAVYASHIFDDVPDSNPFHDDIAWLQQAGVTKGCNPPDNTEFCPGDDVTREQMSAFMHRFAEYLGAEDGTPAEADHATSADTADSAANADTLDGAELSDVRVLWMNVHSTFGIQSRSEGLEKAEVRRPLTNPTGVYCIYLHNDMPVFSAVGAPERAGAAPDSYTISVTTSVRHFGCESTETGDERFDIAVETYIDGSIANNNFQLMIPATPQATED